MAAVEKVETKAKRRIKRFLKTGEKQARVRQVDEKTYEYRGAPLHRTRLVFKRDVLGRLRRVKNT